ncbi:HAD family hydrolase [Microvirga puerhi]|uniref:HAD family phosphatase n=1 Tax=Microvirga puerhi TaxID=2876078 RepID=A0ABS7VSB2_9HYPH|nr:HAD family phosphatase [Microvirga puerhi]MBZ6078425.1 HAD family phosphatase [Microvirga puerhi]
MNFSRPARRPAAVLFDCDGVLADSEPLVNRVIAADLTLRGWPMTSHEAGSIFLGTALPDMVPRIEAMVGPLPTDWMTLISHRVAAVMKEEVEPVSGAPEALQAIASFGIPFAVASNSTRLELDAKLHRLGFKRLFSGRILSFEDVPRPKPWPDIYLAAALACSAEPEDCVVVEDSLPGVRAGVAAGCRVLGFAKELSCEQLAMEGAYSFTDMRQLPALLGLVED